jgi:hypothetical protein
MQHVSKTAVWKATYVQICVKTDLGNNSMHCPFVCVFDKPYKRPKFPVENLAESGMIKYFYCGMSCRSILLVHVN